MFNKRLKQELSAFREESSSLQQVKESLESEMFVLTLDTDGRVQSVNQNFLSEMHKSDELIGRRIEEIVPEHVRNDEFQLRFKAAMSRGEHFAGAVRLLRGTGQEAWLRSDPAASALGQWPDQAFSIFSSD
jgi:methyl-accepting chemotaxis protein